MKLNTKQIKALTNELGEQKFKELTSEIEYDEYKIYVSGGFKLQRVGGDQFAWVDLNTSVCFSNGTFDSALDALNGCYNKPYNKPYKEYNSMKDAIADGHFE